MLEAWPVEVAGPIAAEARNVLTVARTDVLTIGAVAALYFASSGIEACASGSTAPTRPMTGGRGG